MRYYPDFYPRFENEPTADRFEIAPVHGKGEGVLSLVKFKKGHVVFTFAGIVMSEQNLFTLQYKNGIYYYDPFFMGKILHSCNPNMLCDMETRTFTALKPIRLGDILTMDYESTEDYLFRPFECGCGSKKCKGYIKGKLAE